MTPRPSATVLAGLAAWWAAAACAQPLPDTGPAPAAGFRSALEAYQPYAEVELAPWRASNDTVGRIGGWRAYAREAQQGATPAAAPPPLPRAPQQPTAAPPAPAAPAADRHPHQEPR